MRSTVVLSLLLMGACAARAEPSWFQAFGTTTFVPGSPAVFDVTISVNPENGSWELSDSSDACLSQSSGCYLGSFTFAPPAIELPLGARIVDGLWDFDAYYDVSNTNWYSGRGVNIVLRYPGGNIVNRASFDIPGWLYASGGVGMPVTDANKDSLGPVTADVYFWGPPPLGSGFPGHYYFTFALTSQQTGNLLTIAYDFPGVPEPATTWLVAIGVGVIGLSARNRR